jgi:integrase
VRRAIASARGTGTKKSPGRAGTKTFWILCLTGSATGIPGPRRASRLTPCSPTSAKAEIRLLSKARAARMAAGTMTVAQLAERWPANYVKPKLKPRTAFDYERLLTQHILPALGRLLVASVERSDVERLHVAMARTPRRANYTISTTHVLFNHAIDLGLRPPGSNPARRIKRYRERKVERFLSEAEIGKAAEAIERAERAGKIGPLAAGLRLALFTGARSGEITAIEWSHIDWQRRLIRLPDSKTNEPRTIHLSEAAGPALCVLCGMGARRGEEEGLS